MLVETSVTRLHGSASALEWTMGYLFHWPPEAVEALRTGGGEALLDIRAGCREITVRADGERVLTAPRLSEFLNAHIFTQRPLSARLPFSYQRIPYQIRYAAASLLVRMNRASRNSGRTGFPAWPLDLSLDALADIDNLISGRKRASEALAGAALLTHDIDTPESLANLPRFLEIEEAMGVRSTNFVVPCGWPLDHGILAEAEGAGHEIGVHGYNHDNRAPFMNSSCIRTRMDRSTDALSRYRLSGYRAPSLHYSPALAQALKGRFLYDATVPASGGYYSKKPRGCGSARPFFYDSLLELPLTIPSDANLMFQRYSPARIVDLWAETSTKIALSGGMICLLTHCERRYSGNEAMLGAYRDYIARMKDNGITRWLTMREAAESVVRGGLEAPYSLP